MNIHGYKLKKKRATEVLNIELTKKFPSKGKIERLKLTVKNCSCTIEKIRKIKNQNGRRRKRKK